MNWACDSVDEGVWQFLVQLSISFTFIPVFPGVTLELELKCNFFCIPKNYHWTQTENMFVFIPKLTISQKRFKRDVFFYFILFLLLACQNMVSSLQYTTCNGSVLVSNEALSLKHLTSSLLPYTPQVHVRWQWGILCKQHAVLYFLNTVTVQGCVQNTGLTCPWKTRLLYNIIFPQFDKVTKLSVKILCNLNLAIDRNMDIAVMSVCKGFS